MCGADSDAFQKRAGGLGSPPRVRSRPVRVTLAHDGRGITSACAEQTVLNRGSLRMNRDHLRVCGADRVSTISLRQPEGSPPRVRSRQLYFTVF